MYARARVLPGAGHLLSSTQTPSLITAVPPPDRGSGAFRLGYRGWAACAVVSPRPAGSQGNDQGGHGRDGWLAARTMVLVAAHTQEVQSNDRRRTADG